MNDRAWTYITQLQQHIHQLQQHIHSLEQRIQQLETQQPSPHTTVEKLEYHFDQLKIDRLDGTLHIGITPEELSSMNDVSIPTESQHTANQSTIYDELCHYIRQEIPSYLGELEEEFHHRIHSSDRDNIINDLIQQLPKRIAYYENSNMPPPQLHEHIRINIKNEIQQGLREWFSSQERKE
ncbi:spore germination protein GerPC [Gracilibacillus halophilus YIM-C55.5]|uniref:Spore germination protein GerPC n=1 Tax=Gracilibacillus halophilus YIM-C55.5 TaxID=1308866 RepID=N4W621_9BACI|nr:spore germination protein GerPC [Gracilibacillus halophilus]ENH95653.1 spore germination protein GerPC [Gracilibacillus halophilus YIM-C55.5]